MHVYQARGGAPPYRGSFLVSTETVELAANIPIGEQLDQLATSKMRPRSTVDLADQADRPMLYLFDGSVEVEDRLMRAGCTVLDEAQRGLTAVEVVGGRPGYELVMSIPMSGSD
eukprot:TRINITY_DN2816_c0_g1_i1.p2 TRINITY_DN2816_c0_g1~~TRINITY_DN2816_c0_g1_i1.p2  ORF type:complete len:114 (+),score=15.81 TRINITY_DN2816_c0_g1_i1:547-888(+)